MQRCSGHDEEPQWRAGAGFSGTSTVIVFGDRSGDKNADLDELGASVTLERKLSKRLTLSFSVGAVYAGQMRLPDFGNFFDVRGPALGFGLSGLLVEQSGAIPFVMVDGNFAGSVLFNQESPIYALDLRVGVAAGWSFFGWLTPYLVGRAFGGPVFYRSFLGDDSHHYQFGVGVSFALPRHWDLLIEAAPLGEQRAIIAAGYSF